MRPTIPISFSVSDVEVEQRTCSERHFGHRVLTFESNVAGRMPTGYFTSVGKVCSYWSL